MNQTPQKPGPRGLGWFTQKGHMLRKGHMVGEKLIKTRGMPLAVEQYY